MEGIRSHVARFASKREVDPRNDDEFVRPVRLHRKDARATTRSSLVDKPMDMEGMKVVEAEMKAKSEREEKKRAESALVAPTVGSHRVRGTNQKKTEQVYRTEMNEEQTARAKLRYEEALPWHLEDFDGKSTWVGNYEEALSNTWAMISRGQDGSFRITPVEKWYKFSEKAKFAVLDADEAEQLIKKKIKEPRWYMNSKEVREKRERDLLEAKEGRAPPRVYVGKRSTEAGVTNPVIKQEAADADDLDFVEDRFADDEENMLFEEDEDTKEAEERIKRDQLKANVFDLKAEKEYEVAEAQEKKEKQEEKNFGKNLKKALKKREKNFDYASDSSNPYTESENSASDSTETERRKAEEEKQKADPNNNREGTPKTSPEKQASLKSKPNSTSATSKPNSGRATPSNRPSKRTSSAQPLSRISSSSNLKRPGSPLASDASGNESTRSRKKAKKSKTATGAVPTISNIANRPDSPPLPTSALQGSGSKRRAGSGSDTDAGSGGERKRQKLKLKLGSKSPDASPKGSRSASPAPGAGGENGMSSPNSLSPLTFGRSSCIMLTSLKLPTHRSRPQARSEPRSPLAGSVYRTSSSCYRVIRGARIGMWRFKVY